MSVGAAFGTLRSSGRYLADATPVDVAWRRELLSESRPSAAALAIVRTIAQLVIVVVRLRYRVAVVGNFPPRGCVAVSVHHSYWDGPLAAVLGRRVVPVTTRKVKSIAGVGWFLRHYGVFWAGDSATASAVEAVRRGAICWIAPYGYTGRGNGTGFGGPRLGAARIAIAADCPLVILDFGLAPRTGLFARRSLTVSISVPLHVRRDETPEGFTERYAAVLSTRAGSTA